MDQSSVDLKHIKHTDIYTLRIMHELTQACWPLILCNRSSTCRGLDCRNTCLSVLNVHNLLLTGLTIENMTVLRVVGAVDCTQESMARSCSKCSKIARCHKRQPKHAGKSKDAKTLQRGNTETHNKTVQNLCPHYVLSEHCNISIEFHSGCGFTCCHPSCPAQKLPDGHHRNRAQGWYGCPRSRPS